MEIITDNSNVYNTQVKLYRDYIYNNSISRGLMWDEEVVNEIIYNIPDGTDILDIGSNVGLVTLGIIKKAKDNNKHINNIHCFECDPKIIPLLTSNLSPFENVKIYPFALTAKQEICHITTFEINMGCNYIYSSSDSAGTTDYNYSSFIPTYNHKRNNNVCLLGIPLDSISYQFTNRIGAMKIDVEGHEVKVLEGAVETIQTHRPIIVIEIWENINFDSVLKFFQKIKYTMYRKLENKVYKSQDYVFYP